MVDEIQAVIGELSSVTSNIKPEEFEALTKAIIEAERVFVAGMGRSGLVPYAHGKGRLRGGGYYYTTHPGR